MSQACYLESTVLFFRATQNKLYLVLFESISESVQHLTKGLIVYCFSCRFLERALQLGVENKSIF